MRSVEKITLVRDIISEFKNGKKWNIQSNLRTSMLGMESKLFQCGYSQGNIKKTIKF